MIANASDWLKTVPASAGVYQMYGVKGEVLYVGKARNLHKRLSSYFRDKGLTAKTIALMQKVAEIKYIIAASEHEALLLESNLIKKFQPKYNILLRDDKSYPYLYINTEHDFPRLVIYRGAKPKSGRAYGPFPSAKAVWRTKELLQKLFLVRSCDDSFFKHRSRPCLQYQIKRCSGPCVSLIRQADYEQQLQQVYLFLDGKSEEIVANITQKMNQAAQQQQYELAAKFRDQINQLREMQYQQNVNTNVNSADAILLMQSGQRLLAGVLLIRHGQLIGQKIVPIKISALVDDDNVNFYLNEFLQQYYLIENADIPDKIIIFESLPEKNWLQKSLGIVANKKVQIVYGITHYKDWHTMLQQNLQHHFTKLMQQHQAAAHNLNALQQFLGLDVEIKQVDCFDISHLQGDAVVGSCVVYNQEGCANKLYRRYTLTQQKNDDYASMQEVITRRYKRLQKEDGLLPDVIIVDGGKGQLNKAHEALLGLGLENVALIGIAKGSSRRAGLEEIHFMTKAHPINLTKDLAVFPLLQLIRDEAHRFAISFHRAKKRKQANQSILQEVEGVGDKRRRQLLQHFGGLQGLKRASVADIAKVPGISQALAQKLYDKLR